MPKREKNALLNFPVYIASVFSRGKDTEARVLSLSLFSLENNTHSEKRSLFRTHSQKQNEEEQTAAAAEEQVAEKEEEEQVEEASSEDIVIKTTPVRSKVPAAKPSEALLQRYNEYHKCAAEKEKKSALPWRNCTDLFARENGWRNGTKSEKMERGQDDIKIGNKQTCKEISTKNYLIIIYFLLFSLHPPSAEHPFHLHVRSFVERFGGIKRWSNVYALLSVQHRERTLLLAVGTLKRL